MDTTLILAVVGKVMQQPFGPAVAVAYRGLADAEPADSAAAVHAARRLVIDLAIRQCFLQLRHTSVGDLHEFRQPG